MKKIIIILITIWIALLTTFVSFECLSWYHFLDIPTTSVTIRFVICFIVLMIFLLWIILKITKNIKKTQKNKKQYVIYCLAILLIIIYSIQTIHILLKDKESFLTSYPFTVEISKMENTEKTYLYAIEKNQKIYTNLKNIKMNKENFRIELKDYLKENPNVIEEMLNYMELKETYKDGGTKLYKEAGGSNEFTTEGLTIIKCNKMNSTSTNTDIYIGEYDMEYKNDFCENKRIIRLNDSLYYDTKEESKITGRCGTGMEEILYSVDAYEIPTRNYESNFGTNYKIMGGVKENTVEIWIEGKWIIFEKYLELDK